jgi:hypothetical protein
MPKYYRFCAKTGDIIKGFPNSENLMFNNNSRDDPDSDSPYSLVCIVQATLL